MQRTIVLRIANGYVQNLWLDHYMPVHILSLQLLHIIYITHIITITNLHYYHLGGLFDGVSDYGSYKGYNLRMVTDLHKALKSLYGWSESSSGTWCGSAGQVLGFIIIIIIIIIIIY